MFEKFYQEVEKLSIQNSKIEQKRDKLKKYIYQYTQKVQNVDISDLEYKNKELYNLFQNSLTKIQSNTNNWHSYFEKLLELEQFESFLKNYFIVMIFGKVKAGKSSLGNFIAKNRIQKEIEFFRYENAKEVAIDELVELNQFATNNLECTSEIQGFKLGSLAWIDTPGLGSMTKENENLAKKYIDSADYIIYPTNSAQPLQRDEIEELKELFSQNKKVTICITKSDKVINARDKNGKLIKENGKITKIRINKSKEDRKAQEEYVYNEIKKIATDKNLIGDIFSISVLTAKEGLQKNDMELFYGSNIEKLYTLMENILQTKAKNFKKNMPYEGLVGFIENKLLGNIASIKKDLQIVQNSLKENIEKFEMIKENITNDITIKIEDLIISANISKNSISSDFRKIDIVLEKEISKMITQNIQNIIKEFDTKMEKISFDYDLKVKNRYQVIKTTYEVSSVLRKIANFVTFGLVERTYKTDIKEIPIGDNLFDVINQAKQERIKKFSHIAKQNYTEIQNSFFDRFLGIISDMKQDLTELENNSIKLVKSIKG